MNNTTMQLAIKKYTFFLLIFSSPVLFAQHTTLNKYGLWVIHSKTVLQKTIGNNVLKKMIDLQKAIPGITLDLRYASANNFMQEKLYPPLTTTYLRKSAILALQKVQAELKIKNLGLKIWDAYRPYSVTEKMWEPVKDDRYAADPKFGSGHNRGIAVDVTIIDFTDNKELDMGTGFDNFSDTAHHGFKFLPEKILQNRILLKSTMEKYGFKALDTEWWHYYLPDIKQYELLDVPFGTLRKLNRQYP
jgi:zinc D-Ala-D-Ala dipeptidase